MRKPRDFDAELKALDAKAKALRLRQRDQLGELVRATGADVLPLDLLTGALLEAVATTDKAKKEAWAAVGTMFFAGRSKPESVARTTAPGATADSGSSQSPDSGKGA